jgi:hypothetical protein
MSSGGEGDRSVYGDRGREPMLKMVSWGTPRDKWSCTTKLSHEVWRIIDLIRSNMCVLWRVHTHIPDWDCIDLDLM